MKITKSSGKIKICNLFAGIGGNRWLWGDDIEVTAVEYDQEIANVYKQNFPNDTVIVADARQYLLEHYNEYDIIWMSPPCQSHSRLQKIQKIKKYPDFSLYEYIVFLKEHFKGLWVVENVKPYYEPLIEPSAYIQRHMFWSNFKIDEIEMEAYNVARSTKEYLSEQLGIPIPNSRNQRLLLRNCVHPKLGLYIMNELKKNIQRELE